MLDFPRWKVSLIWLVIALGVLFSIPSLIASTPYAKHWPGWLPQYKINLGLDLAGGSHLLYEADARDAEKQRVQGMEDSVATELRRDPRIEISDISTAGGRLSFMVRDPRQLDGAVERLRTLTNPVALTGTRDWDVSVVDSTRVVLTPSPGGATRALSEAMTLARDVVRRRIDPSGTKEPTVVTEGGNRILVEMAGEQDPEALKRLIGQTARLEFKLVDLTADPDQVRQGRAPAGSEVLPMVEGGGGMAVKRRAIVSGDQLVSARQEFDENNRPAIAFKFNVTGARKFALVTQENIGKPFAIILDDKILSAPTIQTPILGGSGQITGNFTVQSANDLAVSLNSGQLKVKLVPIEERTISAELGADSIHKGAVASIVAVIGVILFMLVTYGRFGVYATIALIVNAFLILGIMAIFNATLTLPGIAGFILTIGAAVDANVLINERIREEQRRGRKVRDAVETGYHEARRAIFDANVTHVISAGVMAYFGSGPVRGFAIVLIIGVVTSVFTAVFFTRMLVAQWLKRARPQVLHI
ncbi:MAG: protein translocase subunit SecD [Sphingomicrobium sp.]